MDIVSRVTPYQNQANVLIDRNGAPRLTDFGCASFLSTTLHFTQTNTGPSYSVRWTVSWGKTGHTKEGDIYALGMEAFTTEVPFSGRSDISLYRHVVDRKKTPSRPGSIIPERSVLGNVLWAILMSCWSYSSASRPTAQAVHTLASQVCDPFREV
ncbi:Pkinase domain-containing protein [Rhizoctonia solani AG-1 IA]|uniref:Pkinase domain-containing protein n=1 Tax=Thanatephorus cucumeris (strain AG1-IA) TaxID=983506 RepID=L8WG19_THACA|nr:Pkinase domain-containing protein [Rhizoctonia solani AG-1 IA]